VPAHGTSPVSPKRRANSSALSAAWPASRSIPDSFCWTIRSEAWHCVRRWTCWRHVPTCADRSDKTRSARGQTALSTPHGLRTRQHGEALPALVLQDLPAVALLGEALGDTLLQPFQPLLLAPILGLQGFDGLFAGLDHGLAFALKLPPARFHALRLLALGDQLRMPGSRRLLRGLGRLSTRQALRDASLGAVEPPPFALDPLRFLVQPRPVPAGSPPGPP
jgi:hypothetical protein